MLQFTKNTQMFSKSVWCLSSSRTLTPGLPLGSHTAGGTSAEEQGPYIQFLSRSCPVQEQSFRADHEAGPQKERNIRGGRILLREKQHMVGLWQIVMWLPRMFVFRPTDAVLLLPVMLIYFQMRKKYKFCFAFQKKIQISSPAERPHDYNKAFLIIAPHSKGRNERSVRW